MDTFINQYINQNQTKSTHTIISFKQNIKRLESIVKLQLNEWDKDTFKNSSMITNELIDKYSLNTIISTLLVLINWIKYFMSINNEINIKSLLTDYNDLLNELVIMRNEKDEKQEAGPDELDNWINYDDLLKKVEAEALNYLNTKKSFSSYRNFLLLCLFVLQVPARCGNYLNMKYIELGTNTGSKKPTSYDKKFNYIYKKDDSYHFVMNNYKTVKYIGQVDIIVKSPLLNKLISRWFEYYNKDKKIFITNVDLSPISQTGFTNGLKSISERLLNVTLSVNNLRHIYLTGWLGGGVRSIDEKKEVAKLMGQTYKTSRMELYQRNNIDIEI